MIPGVLSVPCWSSRIIGNWKYWIHREYRWWEKIVEKKTNWNSEKKASGDAFELMTEEWKGICCSYPSMKLES